MAQNKDSLPPSQTPATPTDATTTGDNVGNQSGVPDSQSVFNTLWAQYQRDLAIVQKGATSDNPEYYDALAATRSLGSQLASMQNNLNNNAAKASAQDAKGTPVGDQPYPGGWTDENGKHVDGTVGQYLAWEKGTNDKLTQLVNQSKADLANLSKQLQDQINSDKLTAQEAQNQYTDALNTYKAQMSPMVAALSSSRDIADMTMRGPVIPALLQNMAPKGTNAMLAGLINSTPGVGNAITGNFAQDQPLPVDVQSLGTNIAMNALKAFSPYAQQLAGQAPGNTTSSGGGTTTSSGGATNGGAPIPGSTYSSAHNVGPTPATTATGGVNYGAPPYVSGQSQPTIPNPTLQNYGAPPLVSGQSQPVTPGLPPTPAGGYISGRGAAF